MMRAPDMHKGAFVLKCVTSTDRGAVNDVVRFLGRSDMARHANSCTLGVGSLTCGLRGATGSQWQPMTA